MLSGWVFVFDLCLLLSCWKTSVEKGQTGKPVNILLLAGK